MKKGLIFFAAIFLLMSFSCGGVNEEIIEMQENEPIVTIDIVSEENNDNGSDNEEDSNQDTSNNPKQIKILSLGDSYTIGQSVCEKCRFPEQLKDSLIKKFETDTTFSLKVIAKTGWTTTSLINAIENENISKDFDLVTLLIGVNNQYQSVNFSIYEKEFPALLNSSINAANNDKSKVIVVSIPDYAFTPFGGGNTKISDEIDTYNLFAKNYSSQLGVTFINITDITRQGLSNPALVASDGLHPSSLAYTKFVERILPISLDKLKN